MTKKEIKIAEQLLMEMAERAVTIPEGGKVGKWTRGDRVMLVYSVLCSLYGLNKIKAAMPQKK